MFHLQRSKGRPTSQTEHRPRAPLCFVKLAFPFMTTHEVSCAGAKTRSTATSWVSFFLVQHIALSLFNHFFSPSSVHRPHTILCFVFVCLHCELGLRRRRRR